GSPAAGNERAGAFWLGAVPPPVARSAGASTVGEGSITRSAISEALVRVDEIFFAGRLLAVHRDLPGLQRFGQRDFLRVRAREGRLDLARHTFSQLLCRLGSDLLQERRQEPATDTPRHAEGTSEL